MKFLVRLCVGIGLIACASGCFSLRSSSEVTAYTPDTSNLRPWTWSATEAPGNVVTPTEVPGADPVSEADADSAASTARALRRGDVVTVRLLSIPQPQDIENSIDEVGCITLPLIGSVNVEGRTTSEIREMVKALYLKGFYTQIDVIVTARGDEYYVRGEVKAPGRYPLVGDVRLTQAIAAAGGYTDFAKPSRVRVMRGESVLEFNCERIEKQKEKDPLVKRGDTIVVERVFFIR